MQRRANSIKTAGEKCGMAAEKWSRVEEVHGEPERKKGESGTG